MEWSGSRDYQAKAPLGKNMGQGGHDQLMGVKISPRFNNYGSITSGGDTDNKEQSLLCEYVTDPRHWPFHGILLLLLC